MAQEFDHKRSNADFSEIGIQKDDGDMFFFTVYGRDTQGERINSGGVALAAKMIHEEGEEVKVEVVDNHDGTYKGRFTNAAPGEYTIVVGVLHPNGRVIQDMIRGSPFNVWVGPKPVEAPKEPADAQKSYICGTSCFFTMTKRKSFFSIIAVDKNGKMLTHGGDPFKVKILAPKGSKLPTLPSAVLDQLDGAYVVSYTAMNPGEYQVEVTLNDVAIQGAPFVINAAEGTPDDEIDPSNTKLGFSDTLQREEDGTFSICIVPNNFNDVLATFSASFKVKLLSPEREEVKCSTRDSGEGIIMLSFAPKMDGEHILSVEYVGQGAGHIRGSPFKIDFKTEGNLLNIVSVHNAPEKPAVKVEEKSPAPSPKQPPPAALPSSPSLTSAPAPSYVSTAPKSSPSASWSPKPAGAMSPKPAGPMSPKISAGQPSFVPKAASPASSPQRVPPKNPPKNPPPGTASKWKKSP